MKEPMQRIVEAAGEKWHYVVDKGTGLIFGNGYIPPTCSCGGNPSTMSRNHDNPSRTDLNELFRLAGKLGYEMNIVTWEDYASVSVMDKETYKDRGFAYANNLAEALLNALDQAINHKEV